MKAAGPVGWVVHVAGARKAAAGKGCEGRAGRATSRYTWYVTLLPSTVCHVTPGASRYCQVQYVTLLEARGDAVACMPSEGSGAIER